LINFGDDSQGDERFQAKTTGYLHRLSASQRFGCLMVHMEQSGIRGELAKSTWIQMIAVTQTDHFRCLPMDHDRSCFRSVVTLSGLVVALYDGMEGAEGFFIIFRARE